MEKYEREIKDFQNMILSDIEDIIAMLEETKDKIKNCDNEEKLQEYDKQVHFQVYNEVDLLSYIED